MWGAAYLPHSDVFELILNSSVDINDLMFMVAAADCHSSDSEVGQKYLDNEAIKVRNEYIRQALGKDASPALLMEMVMQGNYKDQFCDGIARPEDLIRMALDAEVDPNSIKCFVQLPTVELSELLFQYGMDPEIFLNLLAQTADTEGEPEDGKLSLSDKFVAQRDKVVQLAIKKGAKPRVISDDIILKVMGIINKMMASEDFQGNIDEVDEETGRTISGLLAEGGYLIFFLGMMEAGLIDLNVKDSFGRTPIMYAAMNKHKHVVDFLIKSGADTKILDNDGKSFQDFLRASQLDGSGQRDEL